MKEVQKVLQQSEHYGLKGIRDRAIMETYYASGVRRFELGTLTLDDVDFELFQLRVKALKTDMCLWLKGLVCGFTAI